MFPTSLEDQAPLGYTEFVETKRTIFQATTRATQKQWTPPTLECSRAREALEPPGPRPFYNLQKCGIGCDYSHDIHTIAAR